MELPSFQSNPYGPALPQSVPCTCLASAGNCYRQCGLPPDGLNLRVVLTDSTLVQAKHAHGSTPCRVIGRSAASPVSWAAELTGIYEASTQLQAVTPSVAIVPPCLWGKHEKSCADYAAVQEAINTHFPEAPVLPAIGIVLSALRAMNLKQGGRMGCI